MGTLRLVYPRDLNVSPRPHAPRLAYDVAQPSCPSLRRGREPPVRHPTSSPSLLTKLVAGTGDPKLSPLTRVSFAQRVVQCV